MGSGRNTYAAPAAAAAPAAGPQHAPAEGAGRTTAQARHAGTAAPRRPRVLLVDDYAPLLVLIGEMLTDHGMEVVGAVSDGTEVLDAIAEARAEHGGVDVIIMDERLPHMSGLEATRHVAATAPGVPVVLYTAFAGLLGDAPRSAGVVAEVSKGSHPSELVDAVRHACGHARAYA